MPFKDNDYVPRLWSYDTTGEAVVLSQRELKSLRDELNKEYLRRWSGYMTCVHSNGTQYQSYPNTPYMDYTTPQFRSKDAWNPQINKKTGEDVGPFTDADGRHIKRYPSWNGPLEVPTKETSHKPEYLAADGNVQGYYWGALARRDFRGCPIYYSPLDRYVDGIVKYDIESDVAPVVESGYAGPTPGMTFPLGTTEWKNKAGEDPNKNYNPFGFTDVTKDRSFKHLIDGLANIVDIDKYFGHGVRHDDPVIPQNPVHYGDDQDPHNSERTEHLYRNVGNVDLHTPGSEDRLTRPSAIASWVPILQSEQRNEYYIRACNYQHWIWYFADISYNTKWSYSSSGTLQASMPVAKSHQLPSKTGGTSLSYSPTDYRGGKLRTNYNPSYYGHRESYTSCMTACTGFCSQTCFHVCDEQCVYMCDDKCGYSCMDGGYVACGSVCIANCRDNCGGPLQEGGSGGNTCQSSCTGGASQLPDACGGQCSGNCSGFMKDQQACGGNCVGYCSMSCETLCKYTCKFNCSENTCVVSCAASCSEISSKNDCCRGHGYIEPKYEEPEYSDPGGGGGGGGGSSGGGSSPGKGDSNPGHRNPRPNRPTFRPIIPDICGFQKVNGRLFD